MAKRDYYAVLGVARSASTEEIKSTYRRLVRKYHPDVSGNDKGATERFKQVQEAYEVLGDTEKRRAYDRFGHASAHMGRGTDPAWGQTWNAGGAGSRASHFDISDIFGGGGEGGLEDVFAQVRHSRNRRVRGRRPAAQQGADIEHKVQVTFDEAIAGTERDVITTIRGPMGKESRERLTVKIPAGVGNGSKIRLRGRGQPGVGGKNGDLIITTDVEGHRYFQREGDDIYLEVGLTIAEAVLGGRIDVPTLSGMTTVTIPPGTSGGKRLRLKGKGVRSYKTEKTGDMYLNLKIVAPGDLDEESRDVLREFSQRNPQDDIRKDWQL